MAPRDSAIAIDPYEVFQQDLHIVGSFAVKKTMQYALNLLESGKVKVKDLISATYPLADFGKAMDDVLNNKDHLKVQIVF